MKKEFRGSAIKDAFWATTRAASLFEFNQAMAELKAISEEAFEWLNSKPHEQWTKYAYDTTSKCEHRTNNMCESFNSKLTSVRKSTPITIFEMLRTKFFVRINRRYAKGSTMDNTFTKDYKKRIRKLMNESRRVHLLPGINENYEVHEGAFRFAVNLNSNTCSGNWWALSGIPYKHTMKALAYKKADPEKYVHPYFSIQTYLETYSGVIYPFPSTDLICVDTKDCVKPPPVRMQLGSPKEKRRREEDEEPTNKKNNCVRCSLCREIGHNKRTCPTLTTSSKGKEIATSSKGKEKASTTNKGKKSVTSKKKATRNL